MSNKLSELWNSISLDIKKQASIPVYKTWVSQVRLVSSGNGGLTLEAPNTFVVDWLKENYLETIKKYLRTVLGEDKQINFVVLKNGSPGNSEKQLRLNINTNVIDNDTNKKNYNPKYTFDSFVIAESNRFAYAAALAVAERPSASYNPLFIYGGVGLGKTHLLQAISYYIKENYPHLKVKYVSSEKFTTDFVRSITYKNMISGFHKKYRQNDVLLVDDIQFLEKKEQTQNEFFHTFNTLFTAGKQIIVSSDRPPKSLATLEDRLTSRFSSGLITDIQQPELETRIAILLKKSEFEKVNIPYEAAEFIANHIKSNIRELEGALTRVAAYSSIYKMPITLELVKQILGDFISNQNYSIITIDKIMKHVAEFFNITTNELKSAKRTQNIAYPRQIAMYISKELTDYSLSVIGGYFNNRDHTTVIHANNKIQKLIKEHQKVFGEVQQIISLIKQSV